MWFKDVHTVYTIMSWGNCHWVGLVIYLQTWHIDILDPLLAATTDTEVISYMSPLVNMLPHLIMATCETRDIEHVDDTNFSYSLLEPLPQNHNGGDCGPYAQKLIEMHSHGYELKHLSSISASMIEDSRMQYALDVYKQFVGNVCI